MPSEITLPPPTLSLKKAPNSYLASLVPLSTYELEKDTKLDVSSTPFNQTEIIGSTDALTPKVKESKSYTFKQLFASLRFFNNPAEEEKISSEEKLFVKFEKEGQTLENDILQLALNADLLEHRPGYSPVKSAYILSLEKLRNCRERPMVQVLLIHQTMTKLQCSVTVNGLHPSLIERRILEKAAFLKRVGKATYSQVAPVPSPVIPKQLYVSPPPPYSRFEKTETNGLIGETIEDSIGNYGGHGYDHNDSNDGRNDDESSDDDDDVPLGILQTYFQAKQQLNITL